MNQENQTFHYGLASIEQAIDLAQKVCCVLGHGKNLVAHNLLLETACAESQLGMYKDPTPGSAGFGLTQGDSIAIYDVANRTRYKDIQKIRNCFGFDLRLTNPMDLEEDPLKAFVFTRCFYKLIPDEIPKDLHSRAEYWKLFYNTALGKGTVAHYVESASRILYSGKGFL
ncbi:MAG: hypothetical protein Alis3KO_00810 [Aliiglaciecola sp.]